MADYPEKVSRVPDVAGAPQHASRRWVVLFCLILFLGIVVRLVHLTGESIWWDEFATVAFLEPPPGYADSPQFDRWNQVVIREPSPTLGAFLRQNRQLDPAAMPMYLAIEYCWNRYVNASPLALRVLSVLLGLALLPVLFMIGTRMYGRNAGLIAMFCAALSPIHVQFSREIRMYGLMTLLAAVAVYAFCRIMEGGRRRWWLLYALAMLPLSWTHPFALLLPFAQGLFWLLTRPRDIKRLFLWGMLSAAVALPAALWVLTIQFWGQDSTESWMRPPTVVELVNDIFADDAIGATYQVNATAKAWEWFLPSQTAEWIISWRWAVGRVMVVAALCALVWAVAASFLSKRDTDTKKDATATKAPSPKWGVFLGLWLTAPPLVLYFLSVFWRPCHQPRYTVHASLALYLALGAAIMSLPRRALRVACVAFLVLFYGYQQMLMVGEPQHPDWLGASRMLHEEAKSDDLILAHNWLWKRVFAYNLGPVPNVVCYGSTHEILAEKTAFFLDLALPSSAPAKGPREVWVVVQTDYFTRGTIAPLEREFEARNLVYDAFEFGGIQRVILYHVRRGPSTPPYQPAVAAESDAPKEFADLAMEFWRAREYETAVAVCRNAVRINPNYARAWSYMGMSYKELGLNAEALEAFQHALNINPMDYPWTLNNHAELLILAGRYAEAAEVARKALEALPGDPWCNALLGRALYLAGDARQALPLLREAAQANSGDMRIRQWLDEAANAVGSVPQ